MVGLQLQPLPSSGQRFVDAQGNLDPVARLSLQAILDQIVDAVDAVTAAQSAAAAAQAAADTAQTAADTAQTAAEAAQDAVDAIVVPPSTTRSVSTSTALNPDDVTVLVDASGGAVTITLSSASGYSVPVVIKKTDATANPVNMVPSGSDTLNGGPGPSTLATASETKTFSADQVSQWFG